MDRSNIVPSLAQRIGIRLRLLRRKRAISQEALSRATGITKDRLSLCERGRLCRPGHTDMSAGELYALAAHLRVPVAYFFDTCDGDGLEDLLTRNAEAPSSDAYRLVEAFVAIDDPKLRRDLLDMVAAIARSKERT